MNCSEGPPVLEQILQTSTHHSVTVAQSLSRLRLFATPCIAERRTSLSSTVSRSLLKLMSIESMMLSNHLILCHPLLSPSVFPSIRVFSSESALRIRWPKCWSFSFSISPSNEHPGLISLRWTGWISLQSKGLSRVFSKTTVQKHQFFISPSYLPFTLPLERRCLRDVWDSLTASVLSKL